MENVTEGLDGLRDRLKEYCGHWRPIRQVAGRHSYHRPAPESMCVSVNAQALGRYAALCQEPDIVPIVEPEVLMDGNHTIERCEEVTGAALHTVFDALFDQRVPSKKCCSKPNMVISGTSVSETGLREGSRHGDAALLAPSCPGCGSGHRVLVRRTAERCRRPRISTPSIVWARPVRGKSASPTVARFRTRRCRRGMAKGAVQGRPVGLSSSGQVQRRGGSGTI